ncbi:MAG: hypothetical protein SGJ00_05335 [bacterium]|nr:hypothetical protein [bacterium]
MKIAIKFISFLTSLLYCLFSSCNSNYQKKIIKYQDGSKIEIWVLNDSIDDGPVIKYYPSGNIQAMFIARNDSVNGIFLIYYENGNLKNLSYMKQTITDGFSYDFYPNKKLKGISFYANDVLRFKKKFNEKGEVIHLEGFLPMELKKVGDVKIKFLNNKGYIRRNIKELVFIVRENCPYDALKISVDKGTINSTNKPGYYYLLTHSKSKEIIISILTYNRDLNGKQEDIVVEVKNE